MKSHNAIYDFHDLALFQARTRGRQGRDDGPLHAPVARSGAKPDHRRLAPAITGSPVVVDGSTTGSAPVTEPVTSDAGCVTLPRVRDFGAAWGSSMTEPIRPLVAYYRVSTAQQGASGL